MRLVQSLGRAMQLSSRLSSISCLWRREDKHKSKYNKLLILPCAQLPSTIFVRWKGNLCSWTIKYFARNCLNHRDLWMYKEVWSLNSPINPQVCSYPHCSVGQARKFALSMLNQEGREV